MKKLALAFFFLSSWLNRYTSLMLDMSRPDTITAKIKGAVVSPGIYELDWNADLQALVKAAGGFTANADTDAVNLPSILSDRQVINIQERAEEGGPHDLHHQC